VGCTSTCFVFAGLPKAKATMIETKIKKIIDNAKDNIQIKIGGVK
jgi:CRISPR/Cas system-associated endoribonuclease Cas2